MTQDCYEGNGFFSRITQNWDHKSYHVPLDKEIIGVKTLLKKICDRYEKKETDHLIRENSYYECNKRKKLLDEIKCLSNSNKLCLQKSLSLVIYILKAYEELHFHGLRSCQRYLVEIASSKIVSTIDEEIKNDNDFKDVLNTLKDLIGDYLEEYESLTYFFQQLDNHTGQKNLGNYRHPKFKFIQEIITGHFQALPNSKVIIFCQSSFYMLEICNLLLQLQPHVRPVLYIGKETKNGSSKECFSQEAITIIENMFECKQFNVLVRACQDIHNIGLEEVNLMIHLDIEQHLPRDVLRDLMRNNLDFNSVDVYLKKRVHKNAFTTLKVNTGHCSFDRKRKIYEYNRSETERSPVNLEKKFKNSKMEIKDIAFNSTFDFMDFDLSNLDENQQGTGWMCENKNVPCFNFTSSSDKPISVKNKVNQCSATDDDDDDDDDMKQNAPKEFDVKIESTTNEVPCGTFASCLSPVLGLMPSKRRMLSSSTPLSKNTTLRNASPAPGKLCHGNIGQENTNTDYCFIDFDLFEDWDNCGVLDKKKEENKSLITLSQAVDMVENTVKALKNEKNSREDSPINLDDSVDLMTGKVAKPVRKSIENLFADSFDLSKIDFNEEQNKDLCLSSAKKNVNISNVKAVSNSGIESIILDFGDSFGNLHEKRNETEKKERPAAAQKLNFEYEQINSCTLKKENLPRLKQLYMKSNEFDGDSSFDDILQTSFLDKLKTVESKNIMQSSLISDKKTLVPTSKFDSSEDFTDDSLNGCRKKGKVYNIEESDSEAENDAKNNLVHVTLLKESNVKPTRKGREFLDLEVEVTDEDDCSSDNNNDDNESDEYEKSFVDDATTFSQNIEVTTKYLESVKETNNRPGTFKIPQQKPYLVEDVFSQMPHDTTSDYEINSFCVNDIEYEDKQLSDLEIAEQILELERKKNRIARKQRKRKKEKS